MAVLGAQQHELPPPPPSPDPSKYKRDDTSFALLSSDAGKCQLSMLLMSQEPWSSDDLLFVIQAQDVSVGSLEIYMKS